MTPDVSTPESAYAYLKSLPGDTVIDFSQLDWSSDANRTALTYQAVTCIVGQDARTWSTTCVDRYWWLAHTLVLALRPYVQMSTARETLNFYCDCNDYGVRAMDAIKRIGEL